MKKIFKNLSFIFAFMLLTGIWLCIAFLFLGFFPKNFYDWLLSNAKPIYDFYNSIETLNFTQYIGLYLVISSIALTLFTLGFQYSIFKIEALRRKSLWIDIPIFSISISGTIIGFILIFINLL